MDKLPEELLVQIIDYTGTCRNIAQCRIVCNHWNNISEPLMFTKQIVVQTLRDALLLYGRLCKNPKYGNRIKYLKFDIIEHIPIVILEELLSLAFTPSMIYMTGTVDDDHFYRVLAQTKDPERFSQLKAIPSPTSYNFLKNYNMALLTFKDTIQEVDIELLRDPDNPVSVMDDITAFKSLRKGRVVGEPALLLLEETLTKLPPVEEVIVYTFFDQPIITEAEAEAVNIIAANNKVEALKKLSIIGCCCADLIEYLAIKYPNVETIEINVDFLISMERNNLKRILNVIKKIPTFKASFTILKFNAAACYKLLNTAGIRFTIKENSDAFLVVLLELS